MEDYLKQYEADPEMAEKLMNLLAMMEEEEDCCECESCDEHEISSDEIEEMIRKYYEQLALEEEEEEDCCECDDGCCECCNEEEDSDC